MKNDFNFEIFETPAISEQEIEQKQSEKAAKITKNKKKNTAIRVLGTIAIVIAAVIAVLCIYLFTVPSHNPEKLVKKYISEINNAEWEKSYSRLYFDKDTPIYDENYINFCKENPSEMALAPGKIIDFEINKDAEDSYSPKSNRIFYSVNYVLEDGSSGTFYLTVMKTNNKSKKLAEYGVLPSQKCFASLKITVPASTEIYVRGIKFNEPKCENNNCIYEIGYTFADVNDIHIVNPYCSEIEEMIEVNPGENIYDFTPEITEECYNNLCKRTEESITSIYTDIINGSEDFSKYKLSDAYKENGFSEDIKKIKENVFMGNYTVSDFKVEEVTLKKSFDDIEKQLSTDENEIEVKYDFRYSYTVTYEGADDKSISQTREGNGYFGIKYVLGNEWYINDISTSAWF